MEALLPADLRIASFSYASAALAYAVLGLLLITRWRRHLAGSLIASAVIISAIWAGVVAAQCFVNRVPTALVFGLELLRDTAWLVFLLRIFSANSAASAPRWLRRGVYGALALAFATVLVRGALHDVGWMSLSIPEMYLPATFALSLVGFILVHHGYRNTQAGGEWSAKFLWIAVGGLFVYDLLLYAPSLMYGGTSVLLWQSRGAALALLVPIMAIGISRIEARTDRAFLSRELVFYSTGVITAGLYLCAVAAGGYYIGVIGGTWAGFAQFMFLIGAALLLAVLVVSGQARAWLRVSVGKNFSPYRHDYRAEWLRLVGTMVENADERPLGVRAVDALAKLVDSNAGGLWDLRDGTYVPSGGDLAGPEKPTEAADGPFVRALVENEWIVDLHAADGSQHKSPVPVPKWLAELPRARYVVPLLQERELVGFIVIAQPLVTHVLNWEDIDLLRTAGRQVASYIALDRAAQQLACAEQFEAFNRFVAFIMHDLKNLIAQQRLVVENASRHRNDPRFVDDAIATIDNSVRRMSRLLEQLRQGEGGADTRRVNLGSICTDVVERCRGREPWPELAVEEPSPEVLLAPERFANVLESVVRNAQDATPARGAVKIAVSREPHCAIVEVSDNGKGMDPAFVRDRLFRPFDSTKGSQGMGIGAYQAREFARSLGGDVRVHSEPGKGTRFVIELPAFEAETR